MNEVYIIYNKTTGRIIRSGRFNRTRELLSKNFKDDDYSAIIEVILEAKKDQNIGAIYLPNSSWFPLLPSSELHKVVDGEVMSLSEQELQAIKTKGQQKIIIYNKMRDLAIQRLISEGKLPSDYKE